MWWIFKATTGISAQIWCCCTWTATTNNQFKLIKLNQSHSVVIFELYRLTYQNKHNISENKCVRIVLSYLIIVLPSFWQCGQGLNFTGYMPTRLWFCRIVITKKTRLNTILRHWCNEHTTRSYLILSTIAHYSIITWLSVRLLLLCW